MMLYVHQLEGTGGVYHGEEKTWGNSLVDFEYLKGCQMKEGLDLIHWPQRAEQVQMGFEEN